MASKAEKLIEALEPIAESNGLELVTVEVAGTTKNPILRVFLDTLEGGITLDQLAEAQQWVDAAIEEIDPFTYSYILEVSSPGIDRPLRKAEDFQRFEGEDVVVYLKAGESRTKVEGILLGMDGDNVIIGKGDEDEENDSVPFSRIKKANIIGRIDFKQHDFKALDDAADAAEDGRD